MTAALGASVGALIWVSVEGVALTQHSIPGFYAFGLVGSYALPVALFALMISTIGAWLAQHVWMQRFWSIWSQRLLSAFLTVVFGSLVMLGLRYLFKMLFVSADVQWIALSLSAPLITLILWGTIQSLFGRWRKGRALNARATALFMIVVGLLWGVSMARLNDEIFDALYPARFLWPLVVFLATWLGLLLWRDLGRVGRLITMFSWLVLFAAVGGCFAKGAETWNATLRSAPSTHLFEALRYQTSGISARMQVPKTGATCHPGVAPTALSMMPQVDEDAPNIILVTVDAMRWDHITLSGYKRRTTPNLAKWARKGAVFSRAYTPATSTRQTFGALFTGVHPSLYEAPPARKWSMSLAPGQETMASALNAAGYHTTAIVVARRTFSERDNALHGFEVIDRSPQEWWRVRNYAAPLQIDRVIATVSDPYIKRPKFVWTHLLEPHQSYHRGPKPKYFGKKKVDRYDSAIYFVDSELDRLIRFVMNPSRKNKTYLILTADHGHAFREHGQRYHGMSLYLEESHVPLIIWGSKVKSQRINSPTAVLDLFPTIFDMAGIGDYASFSCGASLLGRVQGLAIESKRGPSDIYFEQIADTSSATFNAALVRGSYKLMVFPTRGAVELYDLIADPKEQHDLSQKKPKLTVTLVEAMKRYQKIHGIDSSVYFPDLSE